MSGPRPKRQRNGCSKKVCSIFISRDSLLKTMSGATGDVKLITDEHEAFAARFVLILSSSFSFAIITSLSSLLFYCSRVSQYVFVPTKESYFSILDQFADTTEGDVKKPLVLVGNEGSGKSALLANWESKRREHKHPKEFLFKYFVGCTSQSTQVPSPLISAPFKPIFHPFHPLHAAGTHAIPLRKCFT